ncbi:hypothetical protein ACFWIZ_12815, partial [Streptomyces sp. NPDC127044]
MDEESVDSGEDPLALRLETLILGAERRYTPFQAARSAGVSMELASRFWRAMGFADIGQAKALTEADVLALRRLAGLVEAGLLSEARGGAGAPGTRAPTPPRAGSPGGGPPRAPRPPRGAAPPRAPPWPAPWLPTGSRRSVPL